LAGERNVLLKEVRRGTDPERRLRAHLLILLADGWPWSGGREPPQSLLSRRLRSRHSP
jgi:hypothetical protein